MKSQSNLFPDCGHNLTPEDWEMIFLQSKVNGSPYYGDRLPVNPWRWPDSWLRRQMKRIKEETKNDRL